MLCNLIYEFIIPILAHASKGSTPPGARMTLRTNDQMVIVNLDFNFGLETALLNYGLGDSYPPTVPYINNSRMQVPHHPYSNQ